MRECRRTPAFEKSLKALAKKHRGLDNTVRQILDSIAVDGPRETAHQIPGLDGEPVFKERVAWDGSGARGSARIIYRCDEQRVLALLIYAKNDTEPANKALRRILDL